MKKLYLFILFALFSGAITFGQVITWSPAADGLWSEASNWTPAGPPTDANEVQMGKPLVCTVAEDAVFGQLKLGHNSAAEMVVKAGVTLTSSSKVTSWSGIGENAKGKLTIEAGAVVDFGDDHMWINQNNGEAEVHIYGTMKNNVALGISRKGGPAIVTVYSGGQLLPHHVGSGTDGIGDDALLDVRGGEVKFPGDEQNDINGFIARGVLVAYGGAGIIHNDLVDGQSVITSEEDPSAPTIASSSPADTETGVPGAKPIVINFSKWMDHASVEAALTITPALVNPVYTWAQNTLTISSDGMTSLTVYTVTIGTGATDANGVAVASELSFTFTTIDPDAPPLVVSTSPADDATDINVGSPIVINFSKAMDSTSVANAITVVPALENPVNALDESGNSFSIAHDNAPWDQVYTVTVAAGAKASADETVLAADYSFSYTVKGQPQTTIVWNPAQDGSSDGLWTSENWNNTNWPFTPIADGNYKVVTNVPGAGSLTLTDTVTVNCIRLGDNGPGDTLFIEDKAYLKTIGEWNGFGIKDTSVVIIKAGGTLDLSSHAWIGYYDKGLGIVDVYGTMFIKGSTGLNWGDDGGKGVLTIHEGGVLNMRSLNDYLESGKNKASINAGSVIDVNGGEWIINRWDGQKAVAKQYIEAGRITALKGAGFVRVDEDSTVTDIDTIHYTLITSTSVRNADATLSALTSDVGGAFSPVFNPATTTYNLIVPFGSFWATIGGVPADKYASVSDPVFVDLSFGSGQAKVTCTAEDGSTKEYTVNVTVGQVSAPNVSALKENAYYIASQDIVRVENAVSVKMVSVFDITGKLRFNTDVNKSETFDIDASALKQGLYIIQLRNTDGSRKSFKFIK